MTNKQKRLDFLQKISEKYPDHEVVMFSTVTAPMMLKDKEGTVYYKKDAHRFLTHNIRFDAVLHKEKYIQKKLDSLDTGLTLLKYSGMKEKIVVQDLNGFTYSPQCYDILQGHPVTIQSCNEKEALFKYKASLVHNSKYMYDEFKYINGKQKIPVICSTHGTFNIVAESHLLGRGCPTCKKDAASFSKSKWIKKYEATSCIFYIIECYNQDESFIKVGVTSRSITKRYGNRINYNYTVLLEITGPSDFISHLEKKALNIYKNYKYYPKQRFEGRTECFSTSIKNNIYEHFKTESPRE